MTTGCLCASELRFAFGNGRSELIRLAADAGFAGLAVGPACARRDLAPLVSEAASAGLRVPLVAASLADQKSAPGRRLPFLSAMEDGDERLSAIRMVEDTWAAASPLGIFSFILDFGVVPLRGRPEAVSYRHARRELDEDEPGERLWRDVLGERRAISPAVVDACRHSLDRLVPRAEASGFSLSLELTGPWGAPTPREAELLLEEYRGAPLDLVWDEARVQALATLGIGVSAERRARFAPLARVVRRTEAVGIETGFALGLGDPDGQGELAAEAELWSIVGGRADTTLDELIHARETTLSRVAAARAAVAARDAAAAAARSAR